MPRGPQHSEEELLQELRDLAERIGRKPPRKGDMDEHGEHAGRTYQLRFGSWNDAVREAGFEPRAKPTEFSERPDECPLCGDEEGSLDFHHWRYGDNEVGCYLCRECHDFIHQGDGHTENADWLSHSVNFLVQAHLYHHEEIPTASDLVERYNLTNVEPLVQSALDEHL